MSSQSHPYIYNFRGVNISSTGDGGIVAQKSKEATLHLENSHFGQVYGGNMGLFFIQKVSDNVMKNVTISNGFANRRALRMGFNGDAPVLDNPVGVYEDIVFENITTTESIVHLLIPPDGDSLTNKRSSFNTTDILFKRLVVRGCTSESR